MFSHIVLVHRPGSHGSDSDLLKFPGAFSFKTCLRQICILDDAQFDAGRASLRAQDEVYREGEAFGFLLEVICGLHSPLLGETEVYGQFKNAVSEFQIQATPFGSRLKRFFRVLFEDAKRVRQAHLEDLGSQSYGSVLRRDLKGLKNIHIIGAGHLVQEILPWVSKDGNRIRVHVRNVEKARQTLAGHLHNDSQVEIVPLEDQATYENAEALIIAAPMTSAWIQDNIPAQGALVADLRSDSAEDRLQGFARVLDLKDVFARIQTSQAQLEIRKASALGLIETLIQERRSFVEYRPFGWEDVCA